MEKALKQEGEKFDSKELHAIMKSMDLDKNGKINYNEFIAAMLGDEFCQQKDYLDYIFNYFDADKNGKISHSELQMSIEKMGYEIPEKYFKELIAEADSDKDH